MTWLYICVVAFMVGGLIVASERWHGAFTGDSDLNKPQANHSRATPRVGGLAVLAGTLMGLLVLGPDNMTLAWLWPALFVSALPVFVAGLLEDITKDIGASKRLLAAFASAAIAWWLLGGVSRVGMAPVDYILSYWPVSLVFTMFAVGGCTHALNIVDGMNGLAGMVATLMAVSISLVALQVGDVPIFLVAAALASATLGFLVWNFPFGRVFLGDGGRTSWASCWPNWPCCWWCAIRRCRRSTPWRCCSIPFSKPASRSGAAASSAACRWTSRTPCICTNWSSAAWCG